MRWARACCVTILLVATAACAGASEARRPHLSLSGGLTLYRDGYRYGLGPDESLAADLDVAVARRWTVGVGLGLDILDLGYDRGGDQYEAQLRDTFLRYTIDAHLEYLLARGVLDAFAGVQLGLHGVHYSYANPYQDSYGGTGDQALGYGVRLGVRLPLSERTAVLARIEGSHAGGILPSWYYRTHLGVTWRL